MSRYGTALEYTAYGAHLRFSYCTAVGIPDTGTSNSVLTNSGLFRDIN